jgi:putative sterol carrier protein
MTERYEFLSDDWFAAVKVIRDVNQEEAKAALGSEATFNIRIRSDGAADDVWVHLDCGAFHRGRLESCLTEVGIGREVARAILVDGDFSTAMSAFLSGHITVDGDMTQLMAFAMDGGDQMGDVVTDVQERIRAITR